MLGGDKGDLLLPRSGQGPDSNDSRQVDGEVLVVGHRALGSFISQPRGPRDRSDRLAHGENEKRAASMSVAIMPDPWAREPPRGFAANPLASGSCRTADT